MKSNRIVSRFLICLTAWSTLGVAGTQVPTTQAFTVSAQIVSGCNVINSGGGELHFGTLNFGTYSAVQTGPVSAATTGNSGVQIECSTGTNLTMQIDGGLNPTGGTSRNLRGADNATIAYQLYADAGHTQPIGIAQAVAVPASGSVILPIYGALVLPGAGAQVGTYADTVQVTLNY
jgi:spore coat protein U-like protein